MVVERVAPRLHSVEAVTWSKVFRSEAIAISRLTCDFDPWAATEFVEAESIRAEDSAYKVVRETQTMKNPDDQGTVHDFASRGICRIWPYVPTSQPFHHL